MKKEEKEFFLFSFTDILLDRSKMVKNFLTMMEAIYIHKEKIGDMHIVKVGVNYQVTPLEVREKITFADDTVEEAMITLGKYDGILENVILSTCNRTEVFVVTQSIEAANQAVMNFLSRWFGVNGAEFTEFLQFYYDDEAIEHLFKLAVGLDSMVLGETQILGQVRNSFLTAQKLNVTDKIFNELFKRVVTFAKNAHSNTVIGEQAVSISYVAVELSKKIFGEMSGKHAVIIGAGEMGELSLKNLVGSGVSKITVVNRSLERSEQLANRFNATAATLNELEDVLVDADIVISSTGASEPILTKAHIENVQRRRQYEPLFLIDIAMPRDIDASVDDVDHIFLYDIDDLQHVADQNIEARKEAAVLIESEIVHELSSFKNWIDMLDVVPLIRALREKSLDIQERTLASIYRKIPDLDDREMKVLENHTKSIATQLLAEPLEHVKLIGGAKNAESLKELFRKTFGLDVESSDQQHKGKS